MSQTAFASSSPIEPLRAIVQSDVPSALAIITGIDGPSYRPLGATMAVFGENRWTGTLSSGCVEADIALNAARAIGAAKVTSVLYGTGSTIADIQLPCGGGLEVTIIPNPEQEALAEAIQRHDERQPCALSVDLKDGKIGVTGFQETDRSGHLMTIGLEPEIYFYVFGKGPEAVTFGGMVHTAGYPNLLLSPDQETLDEASQMGCATRHLTRAALPADLAVDDRSAVVLFFHDHDYEPEILKSALSGPAFYIGAQGSMRAAQSRKAILAADGVSDESLSRLRGPIGLIPSVRDARKLAVSVLAEVLNEA